MTSVYDDLNKDHISWDWFFLHDYVGELYKTYHIFKNGPLGHLSDPHGFCAWEWLDTPM